MARAYAALVGLVAAVGGPAPGPLLAQTPADPVYLPPLPAHPAVVVPGADGPYLLDPDKLAPPAEQSGWFFALGAELLKPHLKARLSTPGPLLPGAVDAPVVPGGVLGWTGAPELLLGYHLPWAAGDLLVRYRLVSSSGNEDLPNFDSLGVGNLHSRLSLNQIDIDYQAREFLGIGGGDVSGWFRRDLRAGFGVRVMTAFFDETASGLQTTQLQARSTFAGLGPHGFLEYHQALGKLPLWLHTRVSTAGVLGPIRQRFSQAAQVDGAAATGFFDTGSENIGIGTIAGEVGLNWLLPSDRFPVRLTLAYTWERWWDFASTDFSTGELTLQGLVIRGEFRY
jgi:hypothetical protein